MSVSTMAAAWKGSRHGGTELLMLLAIADFADDEGNAYPSISTLAKKCRMKPRNVNYLLKALQSSRELDVRVGQGPRGTNLYRINVSRLTMQIFAGVQGFAGMQPTAQPPATHCAKPLQPIAAKPSRNHQEPSKGKSEDFVLPDWVPAASWDGWVEMRKAIRKPLTARAKSMAVNKLEKLRADGYGVAGVLDQSTLNSWQDLYPLKTATATAVKAESPWKGAV